MKVPVWIDTHCHLDATEFAGQHIQLLQNAFDKQVKVIVIPAVSVDNFESVKNLSLLTRSQKNMPYCVYALGIHPLYIAQAQETD